MSLQVSDLNMPSYMHKYVTSGRGDSIMPVESPVHRMATRGVSVNSSVSLGIGDIGVIAITDDVIHVADDVGGAGGEAPVGGAMDADDDGDRYGVSEDKDPRIYFVSSMENRTENIRSSIHHRYTIHTLGEEDLHTLSRLTFKKG